MSVDCVSYSNANGIEGTRNTRGKRADFEDRKVSNRRLERGVGGLQLMEGCRGRGREQGGGGGEVERLNGEIGLTPMWLIGDGKR